MIILRKGLEKRTKLSLLESGKMKYKGCNTPSITAVCPESLFS